MMIKRLLSNYLRCYGETDSDGQLSQIEVTENFLDGQIRQAQEEKSKNEKLYKKLGISIGMIIVIILL